MNMYEKNIATQNYTGTQQPAISPNLEDVTVLSRAVSDLEKHNAQIQELTSRLNTTIDRLIGSTPIAENAQKGPASTVAGGLCNALEGRIYYQALLIGELESAIRRLSVV